ncbi:MAG: hypothetical protein KC910_06710, partial [Candidatus Eremiobacteraeota bacterium]|nr:hypothetical protein [Candidatus Eremiobacteraeota bacterium]
MRYLFFILLLLGSPAWSERVTNSDESFSLELPADWKVLRVQPGHMVVSAPSPQLSFVLAGIEPETIETSSDRDAAGEVMRQAVAGRWKSLAFGEEQSTVWAGLK